MKQLLVICSFGLALFALAAIGCGKDSGSNDYLDQADCTGVNVDANTYALSVKAILDDNCATSGCHDAATATEGINLSTYALAKSAFENTDLLCSIHHGDGCEPMPDGGDKLPDATIQKLDCWAKNGYKQ